MIEGQLRRSSPRLTRNHDSQGAKAGAKPDKCRYFGVNG
jgi:hypothetical protein